MKNLESYKSEKSEKTSLSELSKETKQYLDNLYKEDIHNLEILINRDLSSWLKQIISEKKNLFFLEDLNKDTVKRIEVPVE